VDNSPSDEAQKADAARPLARLLDDLSPQVRGRALQALKLWATRDSLPDLLAHARREQTDDSDDAARLIDVLTRIPDAGAAEAVAQLLPNPHVRDKAARALLGFGPAAVPAVLPYLNDADDGVRQAAQDLCQRLNVPADRQLAQTLADVGDARIPRAVAALHRLAALRPDEAARAKVSPALNAALLDPHDEVRDAALDAARVWGSPENTDALLKVLDASPAAGNGRDGAVIDLLGSLKDAKAASALAQRLTGERERWRVGKALIALGPPAEDAVLPFLQSADMGARIEACRVLAAVGTGKSLKPLQDATYSLPPGPAGDALWQEAQLAMQKIAART
jgi:HEAT repeat protein